MAQQLKLMEEDRKRKAIEEEKQKKERLKLKQMQAMVDSLKNTRELLYKIGNQGINKLCIEVLDQKNQNQFKIGKREHIEQLLYVLV